MGRPSWRQRTCLKITDPDSDYPSKCYGVLEKLYVRRHKKMIPVGRMCAKCGNIVLGYDISQ